MSRTAQDWAASRLDLDAGTRWLLWHLADYAHQDGTAAFPSVATLASLAGVSERTVQRYLRELERTRFIEAGDQALVAHYPSNRRPFVWDLRLGPGQPNGVRGIVDAQLPEPVDNSSTGATPVSPQAPSRGDRSGRSGVTAVSPNPRTKRTTDARARASCGQPGCDDPDVGSGRGWLADDPLTGAPVPCPSCRRHAPRPVRLFRT